MTLPVPGEQLSDLPADLRLMLDTLSALDSGSEYYIKACTIFVKDPSQESYDTLSGTLDAYDKVFAQTVDTLPREGTLETYAGALATLHVNQNNARAYALNSLLGKPIVGTANVDMSGADEKESALLNPLELAALKTKVAWQIKDIFLESLIDDTNTLIKNVYERNEHEKIKVQQKS